MHVLRHGVAGRRPKPGASTTRALPRVVAMDEQLRCGLEYVATMTALLQRVRAAHPTHGSYEAAEIQWWWSIARQTDELGQLFWFDGDHRPTAAVVVNDFGDGSSALYEAPTLVVSTLPDATPERIADVVDRGLAHVGAHGFDRVELEVDRDDGVMRDLLFDRGFAVAGDGMAECWLDAGDRPAVSPSSPGYRLLTRRETVSRPHHMTERRRPEVERRLRQTSLYRSDLDLVVVDADDRVAGYGLFWLDPVTATGVVEPMRTLDGHRRRGVARHILTTGVDLLACAGAERISIAYQPGNPASGSLYRDVGFRPYRHTDVLTGPTAARG